jgi:CheY-like chemotaxis protein
LAASPDILVTDMVMPGGVTGLELGETLRRLQPKLAIVVTSGYTEEILKTDELRRSGIRLMAKPYEFAELAVVIRQVLAER